MAEFQLARLDEAMVAAGYSQSSLARAIGVTQGTISKILLGQTSNSRHLPRIAMVLGVTLAWLFDATDDPTDNRGDEGPISSNLPQHVTLPVSLPSEAALADAFEGVLRASSTLKTADLALELAKRLPIVLRLASGSIQARSSDNDGARHAPRPSPDGGPQQQRRARRI